VKLYDADRVTEQMSFDTVNFAPTSAARNLPILIPRAISGEGKFKRPEEDQYCLSA